MGSMGVFEGLVEHYVCEFIKLSYLIRYLNSSSPNGGFLQRRRKPTLNPISHGTPGAPRTRTRPFFRLPGMYTPFQMQNNQMRSIPLPIATTTMAITTTGNLLATATMLKEGMTSTILKKMKLLAKFDNNRKEYRLSSDRKA